MRATRRDPLDYTTRHSGASVLDDDLPGKRVPAVADLVRGDVLARGSDVHDVLRRAGRVEDDVDGKHGPGRRLCQERRVRARLEEDDRRDLPDVAPE